MAASTNPGGATPATAALSRAGVRFHPHHYSHDPATTNFGIEAAGALAVTPERVFKTLLADVDGVLVVAIVPVTGMLDLKALAHAVSGKKATMASPERAERKTGYIVGGISPFGQKNAHRTVLDVSAEQFPTIFVSGGRRGLDLELSPADLLAITNGSLAAIRAPR